MSRSRPSPVEPTGTGSAALVHRGAGYTPAELEFMRACEAFMKRHRRASLSKVDYLRVALELGYRKAEPTPEAA